MDKELRNERDRKLYHSNEESKKKRIYTNLKSNARKFLKMATDKDFKELEILFLKEKKVRKL